MRYRLLALLLLIPMLSRADGDVLEKVLAHIRQSGPAKFEYQETRKLELAESPVQTSGYMLTDAEGTLVKLQLWPSRVIMAIAGDSMIYWDFVQNQRHSAPLEYAGAAAQQITVFRSILQGRITELQAVYDLAAETRDKQWTLRLKPKPDQAGDHPVIEIVGDADDGRRNIVVRQADGEISEYRIAKVSDDSAQGYTIAELLREAAGE